MRALIDKYIEDYPEQEVLIKAMNLEISIDSDEEVNKEVTSDLFKEIVNNVEFMLDKLREEKADL